jgi:hypothetical protein
VEPIADTSSSPWYTFVSQDISNDYQYEEGESQPEQRLESGGEGPYDSRNN